MRGCIIFAYLILFWNNVYVSKGWENLSLLPQYKGQASLEPYFSGYNAPPGGAVDGYLQEECGQGTCSITWANSKIKEAWWKFPLKSMANVAYLEIYFRKSTINRHVGFSVFVFNNSSYTPPLKPSEHKVFTHNIATCPNPVMNVTVNRETGGIALYNSKNPPVSTACSGYEPTFATIEICEVKVMGCPSQHYGESCVPCNPKCRDKQCDAFNGSCIYGCRETVIDSPDCSDCRDGYYGTDCTQSCGFCKIDTFCDKSTGICPEGCQGNWDHSHCA
ncbi:uncharacterized protein LOC134275696, partial [Saccostrea cucullata]|uniref:uncharacterized protein LOC134275696 n=1 Tax=Saccostrea cuccullata TaxID=36930 RepID=UPI002ED1FF40